MAPRVSSVLINSGDRNAPSVAVAESPKDYLARSWIPVCAKTVNNLTQLATENPAKLSEFIRTDLGACGLFLKNLPDLSGSEIIEVDEIFDQQILLKFIEILKNQSFVHQLEKSSKHAISALKYAIISTTTVQALAPSVDLDPDKTYLCSLTRQMGLMLAAWNYPRIFAKAQSNVAELGGSLDREVSRILGYSPAQLASEICLTWQGSKQIKSAIQSHESLKQSNGFELDLKVSDNSEQAKLSYCINLGDAMAKIADPEHYPQHSKQWQAATEELKTCLGSNALNKIQENLAGFSQAYTSKGFEFPISLEPRRNLTHTAIFRVTDRLIAENEWIEKCHKLHQERFKRIYGLIDKRGISTDALNELITNLVPDLGFTKGCVYLFDDNKMILTPILRLGKSELKKYKVLSCSDAKFLRHPAVVATSYTTPTVQDNVLVDNEWVSVIASVFGKLKKKAVLYVELSEEMAASIDRREAIVHFKAIQKTLSDCINLE